MNTHNRVRKIGKILILAFAVFAFFKTAAAAPAENKRLQVKVFHQIHCMACQKFIHDVMPSLSAKYADRLEWVMYDIADKNSYEIYLQLEKDMGKSIGTPTVVVNRRVLVGLEKNVDNLDRVITEELASQECALPVTRGMSVLEHFKSFGPWAVIGAGLVDGINPCAFTVIVFFVSFLTVMGYKRREMLLIGSTYIAAVFFTYLAIGLGLFKAFYCLNAFFWLSKVLYFIVGALSIVLGLLALRDYVFYKKTGRTDAMALQLPQAVKNRIHAIVGRYYRQPSQNQTRALGGLFVSALTVGFLISLLEAVCTGQLYLPTIVIVLKEGTMRARAVFYLVLYNIMFILPLVAVLALALLGNTSRDFEAFAKKNLGLVKVIMALVFLGLGAALWLGVF